MWGRRDRDRRRADDKERWLHNVIVSLETQMIKQTEDLEATVLPTESLDGSLCLPKDVVRILCGYLTKTDLLRLAQCSKTNRGYILYQIVFFLFLYLTTKDDLWKQLLQRAILGTIDSFNRRRNKNTIGTTYVACAKYSTVYEFAYAETFKDYSYLIAKASLISLAFQEGIKIPL